MAATWATALVVFSGPGHENDLAARLRARGVRVDVVDTKVGGAAHDVLRQDVGRRLVARTRRGEYDVVFIATPCESFSVAHRPQLRSRKQPDGLQNAPPEWAAYLRKHNALAAWSAQLAAAADEAGAAWAIENPADRGDRASDAHWERYSDHAPLWLSTPMRELEKATGARRRTFAQCALGGRSQKWTTLLHSAGWAQLGAFDALGCPHGMEKHAELAHGRDAAGRGLAKLAAAYPPAMNELIAEAAAGWLRARLQPAAAGGANAGEKIGGRVADGFALAPLISTACEEARHVPPRFASSRNKRAATEAQLRAEPLPGGLQAPPPPRTNPRPAVAQGAAPGVAEADAEARRAATRRLAEGPVAIDQLYLDGVYAGEVTPWLREADEAARALRAGKRGWKVPTITIGQEKMQPWARRVVWDCAEPTDCRPVTRSDRHTVFKGRPDGEPSRQIDRAALRRAAAELDWYDTDIVLQAGEGGVEVRSSCALETVLAFHHQGLTDELAAAEKAVQADWKEGWADRPVRHLPFVPCRVLPRNVVMQERARLLPGETASGAPRVELYMKPRITQDSSHGGEESVNAGVADDERYVLLPTLQQHARGVAICDTAGEVDGVRAQSYVVDAESAYRFVPVQTADLWTQCFIWWEGDEPAGICVDRRLGFGGAFAPNRFERISTLCAAHVQRLQREFDATQPLPPSARRWAAERASRQQRGELPSAEAQRAPRYLQVYIDDFSGAALDDRVVPPPSVAGIVIDPRNTSSAGGKPAQPDSRVYVHAQLAVVGLRELGLNAAPSKIVVGDPVVALGLRVGRGSGAAVGREGDVGLGAGRVDCPELKRQSVRAAAAAAAEEAVEGRVDRERAETLVGRLCNLSQAFPELKLSLAGGYTVTRAEWSVGGVRRKPRRMTVRQGGEAQTEWLELLALAEELLEKNEGVALAPELAFPERTLPGALTVVSDASGVDGVGGYVFDPAQPGRAWVISEKWPPEIQRALDRAAKEDTDESRAADAEAPRLSMPAAELFGQWAVAAAAAEARGGPPTAVTAVGDCEPAAGALNAAASGNAQMRALLAGARGLCQQWLAVHVPREWNQDADRLSHPAQLESVLISAQAAEVDATHVAIPEHCWEVLRRAAALGAAARQPRKKRKGAAGRGQPPPARNPRLASEGSTKACGT